MSEPVIATHENGFCSLCYGKRYKVFSVIIDGNQIDMKKCERCRKETLVRDDDNLVEISE